MLIAVLLVFSASHRVMPTLIPYPVLTFTELSHWPNESTTTWKGKGEFLAEQFPGGPDVEGQPVIAVAPLGVLPYFADLPTVDMLGLTDPVTARTGYAIEPYYPGHVRMARVEHLLDEDVNLVLAQPGATDPEPDRDRLPPVGADLPVSQRGSATHCPTTRRSSRSRSATARSG